MQTFTGLEYLKIDIASNFGLDKETFTTRLDWFEQNEANLHSLVQSAETPALFYAGILAYEEVLRGNPIGYPVSLDATSSGLQILAALTCDRKAAELCNVVKRTPDSDERSDAYTAIYNEMLVRLGGTSKIQRSDTKQAVMTALYGSKAMPKKVFGEGQQLQTFYDTMEDLAPGAWELNEQFLFLWDKTAYSNDWVLPDNFHVHVKVMSPDMETIHVFDEPINITRMINAPMDKGRSLGANTVHSIDGMIVREMTRRCDYDPNWIKLVTDVVNENVYSVFATSNQKKEAHRMVNILWTHYLKSGYLSARILDYIDSETIETINRNIIKELLESLPVKPFKIICTHDCFRALPHYMNDVRKQYNLQMYMIANSNLLSDLLSQITSSTITIDKIDPDMVQDIMDTDYALS